MYDPLHGKTGVATVTDWVDQFPPGGPDGLTFVTPGADKFPFALAVPERLREWLIGLRLLKHLPLSYLVPDPRLLPTESIRFFHVDMTWIDRVIDGVFAAGNTGTVDATFTYSLLEKLRAGLDEDLEIIVKDWLTQAKLNTPDTDPPKLNFNNGAAWKAKAGPMTGLLIRSELVRRWPDMIVEGFSDNPKPPLDATILVAPLRREPISKDIYIALFAGMPRRVDIREPNVGTRFGVEGQKTPFKVDRRDTNGMQAGTSVQVSARDTLAGGRVLNIGSLNGAIPPTGARMIALHLEQRAYVQTFRDDTPESTGAEPLPKQPVGLTRGRTLNLGKLATRLATAADSETV